jgi:hypothetical protein
MKREFKNKFQAFATDQEKYHTIMDRIYGTSYSWEKAESIRQRALARDYTWLPDVQFVPDQSLEGRNGVFWMSDLRPPTIFMSDRLLKDPSEASKSFMRGVGFHLDISTDDDEKGPMDAYGNEGEIFRAAVSNEPTSLDAYKDEPFWVERANLIIDGQLVYAEVV